jgi:hypothetical protein
MGWMMSAPTETSLPESIVGSWTVFFPNGCNFCLPLLDRQLPQCPIACFFY